MSLPSWLPKLVLYSDHGKDWNSYEEFLYKIFVQDIITSGLCFNGKKVSFYKEPMYKNKVATFWHVTSEDFNGNEEDRPPDFRRCERIGWIKAIIENNKDSNVKVWENERGNSKRTCVWFDSNEDSFIVVLETKPNFYILKTAYQVEHKNRKERLEKEYQGYKNINTAKS